MSFLFQDQVESGNILVAIPYRIGYKNLQHTLFNLGKIVIKTKTIKLMYIFRFLCRMFFEKALSTDVPSFTPDFLRGVLLGQKRSESLS